MKIELNENQKSINEVNKAIDAVTTIFSSSDDEILTKLEKTKSDLEAEREAIAQSINDKNEEITEKSNDRLKVTEFVR